jgi:hypothetical protein
VRKLQIKPLTQGLEKQESCAMQDNIRNLPCRQSREHFVVNPLLLCCNKIAEVEQHAHPNEIDTSHREKMIFK